MAPKSGMQRTKTVGYDDDDDYYYEDQEVYDEDGSTEITMTEDDREQMRTGTVKVRAALGDSSIEITDAEIQEALWHYYYDIEKSVVYLKNKLSPATKSKTPAKNKAASRFDQAAQTAYHKAPIPPGKQSHEPCDCVGGNVDLRASSLLPNSYGSFTRTYHPGGDFFWDVPWGNVPSHRLGEIMIDRPLFRCGLLGGSSKLALLAAKRRKEREESQAVSAQSASVGSTSKAISMLDQLSIQGSDPTASVVGVERDFQHAIRGKYFARKRSVSPTPASPERQSTRGEEAKHLAIEARSPAHRSQPSSFASTLCGGSTTAMIPTALAKFTIPYMHHGKEPNFSCFNDPSPEDIVHAAQAKSAGGGRH